MLEGLMQSALQQGLGYGMFIFLLLYVLKTTGEREKNYQSLLEKLTQNFNIVEDIKEDVKEIKSRIEREKQHGCE